MPTHARSNVYERDDTTDDSESLILTLLAAGSAVALGYFAGSVIYQRGCVAGRVSYQRDVQEALRRIEESPDPIEITLRAL
jgi:hypothetical protein